MLHLHGGLLRLAKLNGRLDDSSTGVRVRVRVRVRVKVKVRARVRVRVREAEWTFRWLVRRLGVQCLQTLGAILTGV